MKYTLILISLLLISFLLHFYNISWGSPYFFHPDERNIASSISQLHFPHELNPHFFAYGSLPIYFIYIMGSISSFLTKVSFLTVGFEHAIIIGRALSAILASLTIIILYFLGTTLYSKNTGILAASLATFSIGFIQYAHFATFEMWLTFFTFLLTYVCISYLSTPSKKGLFFIAILLGILISIKVSSFVLFLPVLITLYLSLQKQKTKVIKTLFVLLIQFSCITFLAFSIFFSSNPFILLDTSSFLHSMKYETSVASGELPVFYTEGFKNTIPIFYQLVSVYPFVLNPFITLLFFVSFPFIIWRILQDKNRKLFVFFLFFLSIFVSQTILFVKWTRYIIPTLPYIYLMIAYTCLHVFHLTKTHKLSLLTKSIKPLTIFILTVSCFYSLYFFYEVYIKQDPRIQAYQWAKKSISPHEQILSEVYDLGIVPFNDTFPNITLFNFYDLETNPQLSKELNETLKKSRYIILPSQRIVKNRLLQPSVFPKGNAFYFKLFHDKSYKLVYETPCAKFCQILYNGHPVFNLEETTSVFDRPTVYIFKKI